MIELTKSAFDRYKKNHGFVYLIHAEGTPRYKIGRSQNPRERLVQLQGQSPYKLVLKKTWWTPDCFLTEAKLHERFADYRVFGEWFDFPDGDVSFNVGYRLPVVYELSCSLEQITKKYLFAKVTDFCPVSPYIYYFDFEDSITECKSLKDFLSLFLVIRNAAYHAEHHAYKYSKDDNILYFATQERAELYLDSFCELLAFGLQSFHMGLQHDFTVDHFEMLYVSGGDR